MGSDSIVKGMFAEIGLWCLGTSILLTFNIVVLRNMISQIYFSCCDVIDDVIQIYGQIVKSGERRNNLIFFLSCFGLFDIVWALSTEIASNMYTKLNTIGM